MFKIFFKWIKDDINLFISTIKHGYETQSTVLWTFHVAGFIWSFINLRKMRIVRKLKKQQNMSN